ncbi:MAG: Cystathionine beta-lyase [Bacteroidota bacterium]
MKKYDFNQVIDRKNTFSFKWDNVSYGDKDILPMPVADMDFPVADEILQAIDQITDHKILGYSIVPESLQIAAQKKISQDYGWETELAWQVWIPGIVPGITAACAAFSSPEDGILTAVPVYHPFHLVAGWLGHPLHTFPMIEESGRWTYDFVTFENALKKGPKVFLFCNPHNPGGTVFSTEEISRIKAICHQYDCKIISDEIHADLIIDPQVKHTCIQSEISFFATSKAYNTAGLGGAVAIIPDAETRLAFQKKTFGFFPMLSRHSIEVMLATFAMPADWIDTLLPYLRSNHALLLARMNQLPGIKMLPLEATYLAWIGYDSQIHGDLQKRLFDAGLHVLRGDQFLGGDFIRLNFACPEVQLLKAIEMIESIVHASR